ncbi:hypothetical protein SAMN04487949_0107 [Halogranum gelatinilyticum]|uniref:Holin-X, holin superfamily III n=1 Tax=Halogranum gelatinilyticum TaxID=660521 RepID=A0A1G9NVD9_9EURY|nr:hypothetical protein [Halogranum gelatinilyticum]SDL89945.1 hypothetical protein SAMN04487949_0107 [Halogranum gelatinilyticum]
MPSTEPTEDEIRAIARDEIRRSVRSVLTSLGYLVAAVLLVILGINAASLALFAIGPLRYVGVVSLALVALGTAFLVSDLWPSR